ncbi:MAG: porin family protein [Ignavibacteriaceae bacterium]
MKKALLVLVVSFLVLGSTAFAQMNFGVKAGLNVSNFGGDDADDTDSKTGLVLGGYMIYRFSDMFALQPELLYSMKGATGEAFGADATVSLNYIEIPVLVKFLIPIAGGSSVTPAVFAGPAIGFNVSANSELEIANQTIEEDIKDNVQSLDLGLALGASIDFPVGMNTLGFDVRYTLGLTSWSDVSGVDADVTNTGFSLTAYFGF